MLSIDEETISVHLNSIPMHANELKLSVVHTIFHVKLYAGHCTSVLGPTTVLANVSHINIVDFEYKYTAGGCFILPHLRHAGLAISEGDLILLTGCYFHVFLEPLQVTVRSYVPGCLTQQLNIR